MRKKHRVFFLFEANWRCIPVCPPQLKGVLYAKFWNLEDTCLCVCVFVTNLVLFRWVETSNNRICWSCIFIFQASYCLMKVNFPVLCGYLFSRFLYKNKNNADISLQKTVLFFCFCFSSLYLNLQTDACPVLLFLSFQASG